MQVLQMGRMEVIASNGPGTYTYSYFIFIYSERYKRIYLRHSRQMHASELKNNDVAGKRESKVFGLYF